MIRRFKEYIRMAFRNLERQRTRSFLTMLGIFIGIALVVALISLGQGMKNEINNQFQTLGNDKIFIQPKTSIMGMSGSNAGSQLTKKDADFLKQQQGIQAVSYYAMTSAKIHYHDSTKYFLVAGVPTTTRELQLINSMWGSYLGEGELLAPGDTHKANLGFYHQQKELYDGKNINLNSKLTINGIDFRAKGFYKPIGDSIDDKMIVIPYKTFEEITGIHNRVDFIILQVADEKNLDTIAQQLTRELTRYHGLPEGHEDFTLQTPDELMESFNTIINVVQGVFIGIALLSLLVGIIGIMNTMYTSVLERKKEIGIMKAIGAQKKDILTLFLLESGLLGLVGGIIGILLGIGLATAVEKISTKILGATFLKASYSIGLILGSLALSFIIGLLAGTLPAKQASEENPTETLRDE